MGEGHSLIITREAGGSQPTNQSQEWEHLLQSTSKLGHRTHFREEDLLTASQRRAQEPRSFFFFFSLTTRYALLGPKNFIFILNIKTTQGTNSIYNTFPSLHRELNFSIKTLVLRKHETVKRSIKLTRYFTHS